MRFKNAICLFLLLPAALASRALDKEIHPRLYSVEVSATVQSSPSRITLDWPFDFLARSYTVSRKLPGAGSWGAAVTLPGAATQYIDNTAAPGVAYTYKIWKTTDSTESGQGFGYINAGINAPLVEDRGKVILIVDQTHAAALASELALLEQDLAGDGWTVLRHDVAPSATVQSVKSLIQAAYAADPAKVKSVFLLGHIPVPYSGNINPDEHSNHLGAWPADVYYGDVDGAWTDSSVNNTTAERENNWNIPGDGKFDQSSIPSDVELAVGRVDFSDLTNFRNKTPSRTELDLLRQYLNKNHAFRHGLLAVPRRGLVCDNFADLGEDPVAGSAWRNLAPMLGQNKVLEAGRLQYFSTSANEAFLWGFGAGGGEYQSCDGIGSSDDFAIHNSRVVFTMFMGSYFGDWDNESNFLRSSLGSSTHTLTCSYSGFPNTLYFPMGLGEPIGHCIRLTQNNGARGLYPPANPGAKQIHIGLLGDPTLRLHPVLPPSNLSASTNSTGVRLQWEASADSQIVGYHVYRSTSARGPFARANGPLLTAPSFTDRPAAGRYTYMVRAVKLETSGSGTYYNGSQGVFAAVTAPDAGNQTPWSAEITSAQVEENRFRMTITGADGHAYKIERTTDFAAWTAVSAGTFSAAPVEFEEDQSSGGWFYRVAPAP